MQLKSRSAVILILGIFWGIIGLSMVTGNWQTKATMEEVVVNSPSDIKGWMTLTDVSGYFKIPVPELVKILGLPSNVETKQPLKEIAGENGKEVDDLREILAAQTTQPAETPKNQEGGSGEEQVIKGKMTLSEVEYVTKVPANHICQQLGIPETVDRSTALRDLGQEYGFEVDRIKDIVAKYKP
jgi:hypothetical protein